MSRGCVAGARAVVRQETALPTTHPPTSTCMSRPQVCLEVPTWSSFLSVASIESAGSGVMQNVLNVMVPRFLAQLQTDYVLWAAGDESRKPVGEI